MNEKGNTNNSSKAESPTFEQQLKRLEEIVSSLDQGSDPLEQMLKQFEEGMQIIHHCRLYLEQAELKVIEIARSTETPIMPLIAISEEDVDFDEDIKEES